METSPADKKRLFISMVLPAVAVAVMWLVKITETVFHLDFTFLGIYPLHVKGLPGLMTAPFIHADFSHLLANSIPLFVTLSIIFYFYRDIAYSVMLLVFVMTGIWVWTFARESYHIGASGIVYGYISFLFFSGFLRRHPRLMAVSLLVTFLYGGFFWGIFPEFFPNRNISWESHLMGALSGLVLAVYYRKSGLQKEEYVWEEDEEDENGPWAEDDPYDDQGRFRQQP